jgi:hypothetical protein
VSKLDQNLIQSLTWISNPILTDAIEKYQSMPPSPEMQKDEVKDDETLLDHLVKLTNGMWLHITVMVSDSNRRTDWRHRSHHTERRDFEHLDSW